MGLTQFPVLRENCKKSMKDRKKVIKNASTKEIIPCKRYYDIQPNEWRRCPKSHTGAKAVMKSKNPTSFRIIRSHFEISP